MIKTLSAMLAVLVLPVAIYSTPVGNTAAPQLIGDGFFISRDSWVDVRTGYEGDFVTNARMNQIDQGSGRVDGYKQNTNSGTVTLNVLDRIDLYGVLGSSNTNADWRYTAVDNSVHRIEVESDNDFLWAVGARGIFFEWGKACLGLGGRYSAARYTLESVTTNGMAVSAANAHLQWNEWQVNLDISYRVELLTPYIGIKYSSNKTALNNFPVPIANDGAFHTHFRNAIPVGIFLGCSLSNGKYFMLNLEARLVDEEAITVSGDIRF